MKSELEQILHYILQILVLSGLWRRKKREGPERVLLCRCDSIGDVVLFSASLPAYRALFRDAELVLVVKSASAPLVSDCPCVDEIWILDESKFRTSMKERWRWFHRLQGGGFDLALNTVYSRSFDHFDCIAGWTGAPRRIAHHCLDRIKPRTTPGLFYNELAPATGEWKPETERNADLLYYLGWTDKVSNTPQLWIQESDTSKALRITSDHPEYGILSPGAGFPEKRWDPGLFADTIKRVNRHKRLHWFVCGTPREAALCATSAHMLRERSIPATNLSGGTTIGEFAALIKHATIVLGNDSSSIHLASALETPAVFVLGGGHYGRFFSGSPGESIIPVTHHLPCFQCYWHCILSEYECITKVSVDQVVDAVLRLPSFTGN